MIQLSLYGNPVPKARARTVRTGSSIHSYDPQQKLKEGCKWQLRSQYVEPLLTCPIRIDLLFRLPIPKATSGIRKRQMINGVFFHIKKPDIDNLTKFVLDCLNGIVFEDDSQIVDLCAKKVFSVEPGTLIRIASASLVQNREIHGNAS
jgi:Holliday junction resolvase RusA-like endonuclease